MVVLLSHFQIGLDQCDARVGPVAVAANGYWRTAQMFR